MTLGLPAPRPFASRLVLASIALWLGVLLVSGLTAAVAFPTLKPLSPHLPAYAPTTDHWKIAAGAVANRVFTLAGWAQCALAALAMFSLAAHLSHALRGWLNTTRLLLTLAAALLQGYLSFLLVPRMNRSLTAFMDAARSADPQADSLRKTFDADHPLASNLISALAAVLFLSLIFWVLPDPHASKNTNATPS